jgi:hypothetical protein
MSAEVVQVVRDLFRPPYPARDSLVRAGNLCTIVTLSFGGYATFARGMLVHGPRSGNPSAASWAEGRLLIHGSYSALPTADLTTPPFREPPDEILVRIEILDEDRVLMQIRATPYQPTPVTIEKVVHGVLLGTGTIGRVDSPILIELREPQVI